MSSALYQYAQRPVKDNLVINIAVYEPTYITKTLTGRNKNSRLLCSKRL